MQYDVLSFQGGVGKVAGLRRGSHEAVLGQNQDLEGESKLGERQPWVRWSTGPGGPSGLGHIKLRIFRVVLVE